MEKIYVEGNNQQQQNQNSNKRLFQVSVVLSFLVAAFAIVSLIAVGFNQVSYAADDDVNDEEVDEFTYDGENSTAIGGIAQYVDSQGTAHNGVFNVPVWKQGNNFVYDRFCLEHHTNVDTSYVRDIENESSLDNGVLYILSRSGIYNDNYSIIPKDILEDSGDASVQEKIKYYVTQVAIWVYLGTESDENGQLVVIEDENSRNYLGDYVQQGATTSGLSASDNFEIIKNISSLYINGGLLDVTIPNLYQYIEEVVMDARYYRDSFQQKSFVINGGEDFSLNDDESFYQSSAIDIVGDPSDDLMHYSVTLTGDLVDDVVIVDEDGEERESGIFSAAEKFYLRIPSDKVNSEVQTITVNVEAVFDNYLTMKLYVPKVDTENQRFVGVDTQPGSEESAKSLEVVAAEDTGISRTQTVYFIGLIVLLCGIGIIYANAKPIKNN